MKEHPCLKEYRKYLPALLALRKESIGLPQVEEFLLANTGKKCFIICRSFIFGIYR
jgi:hypothetical protein